MTVSDLAASNGFTQTNTCNKGVKPGTHCDIYVKFAPSVGGITTGSLTLSDNTPSSPQTISLSGTATAIGLTPSALSFSARRVGTKSSAKSVVVKNHGTNAVLISAITLAGNNPKDFSFTTNCGASLSPNATCSIAAKFVPTAKGIRKATINVFDDGGGSPQKSSMHGTRNLAPEFFFPVANGATSLLDATARGGRRAVEEETPTTPANTLQTSPSKSG